MYQSSSVKTIAHSKPAERDHGALGIPSVRATTPGDEITDFQKYKITQENKLRSSEASTSQTGSYDTSPLRGSNHATNVPARRFHLTRDISTLLKANPAGGIRRPRAYIRPPLATFIEKHPIRSIDSPGINLRSSPVDSILEVKNATSITDAQAPLDEASILSKTPINPFLKPSPINTRSGNSIRDDPTTWDQDSDQLANELAALAFDIDPGDASEPPQVIPAVTKTAAHHKKESVPPDNDDDFILETYVRVKRDPNVDVLVYANTEVGVLIIDDENEDLWERYIHDDDDDDEWNEEDEDSNGKTDNLKVNHADSCSRRQSSE